MTQPGYTIGRDEHGLTKRERQVQALRAQGVSNKRAATTLGISFQRVGQICAALRAKEEGD
jgi:DNA-binding CsgD family transcriptional regulator